MPQLRNTSGALSRRPAAALASTVVIFAGATLAACSSNPVEPTATAAHSTVAPTGPVHSGYTPGWGFGGGTGTGGTTSTGLKTPLTPADSVTFLKASGTASAMSR